MVAFWSWTQKYPNVEFLCVCVAWYNYSDLPSYEELLIYKSAVVNQLSLCPEGSVIRIETI